jgi:hypothetical protein
VGVRKFIFYIFFFVSLCSTAQVKHFYGYSCRINIESTNENTKDVLNKTEAAANELLNELFFQKLAIDLKDTTLQRIAKSGSFVVVNEYRNKISTDSKTNCIYILIEFNNRDSRDTNMKDLSRSVFKNINIELEKKHIKVSKKPIDNDYYN